jgi:hypothetical protein
MIVVVVVTTTTTTPAAAAAAAAAAATTTTTQYSKFQFKICFNKVIGFLKKSTSLNIRFAAKTHLTVGEFLLVAKNKQWLLKLHKHTLVWVVSKKDRQKTKPSHIPWKSNEH